MRRAGLQARPKNETPTADRRDSSRACRQPPVRRGPIWVSLMPATSRQHPRSAAGPSERVRSAQASGHALAKAHHVRVAGERLHRSGYGRTVELIWPHDPSDAQPHQPTGIVRLVERHRHDELWRRQPSCPDATRGRALAMGRSEGSARLGAVDGRRRSAIIDRPASRTRSSGTSRFSALDFEVGLAQRKLSNRCLRATCSIE